MSLLQVHSRTRMSCFPCMQMPIHTLNMLSKYQLTVLPSSSNRLHTHTHTQDTHIHKGTISYPLPSTILCTHRQPPPTRAYNTHTHTTHHKRQAHPAHTYQTLLKSHNPPTCATHLTHIAPSITPAAHMASAPSSYPLRTQRS